MKTIGLPLLYSLKEEARIIMGFKVWHIEYLPILFGIVVLLKGMKWLRSASFHGLSQS